MAQRWRRCAELAKRQSSVGAPDETVAKSRLRTGSYLSRVSALLAGAPVAAEADAQVEGHAAR